MKKLLSLSIMFFVILIYGCKKESSISNTPTNTVDTVIIIPPTPVFDSILVLSAVTNSNGARIYFDYDTLNKRLKSWSFTYPSYSDSTLIFYNADGKVNSLVKKKVSVGSNYYTIFPSVFFYNSQGKLIKIYHKRYKDIWSPTSFDPSYYTSLLNPTDINEIDSYDSLNYNSSNKISSIYNKTLSYNPTPTFLSSYMLINYSITNDSLISKINSYTSNQNNSFDLTVTTFDNYNNRINPYYKLIGTFCFAGGTRPFNDVPLPPNYFFGFSINKQLSINPYLPASINSQILNYTYNSDLLPIRCINGAASTEWTQFFYQKVRK
jgi:hypothetical protein